MGTVTLGDGRKLTVGDEFARLSPEEQQSWVNEVAVKFPAAQAAPAAPSVPISDSQYAPGQPSPTAGLTRVPITGAPPDDHGLARRQAMSPVEKAISPITEYPRHAVEMRQEAEHQFGRGVGQLTSAFSKASGDLSQPGELGNLWEATKGAGNVGLGALGYTFSPLSALYRSIVGQPLEDVTGIPREQTEFVAQLATPGIGFTRSAPLTESLNRLPGVGGFTRPGGGPGMAPPGPMIRPVDVNRDIVGEAAQRLQGYTPGPAEVPRTITGGPTTQATGQYLSNAPYAGQPIAEAVKTTLPQQLEQTRNAVAAEYGAGTGANVAERAGATLKEQAAAEKAAADAAAAEAHARAIAETEAANAKAQADWQAANQAREAGIAAPEAQAAQRAQQTGEAAQQAAGPNLPVRDMGSGAIDRTRTAHDSLEARKNALYDEAGNIDARISDRANIGLHGYVERSLEHAGIHIQEIDGIRGSRSMLRALDRFSEAARAREPLAPVGQSMQEIEQLRKNLNLARGTAENPSDERIAKHIMNALDDWQARAAEHHLMPGSDPRALPAFLDARATNRDLMQRYGYNAEPGDHAGKLINKIVRGDQSAGENTIAKALTDSGDKGPAFYQRLMEATNNDPEVSQAVRSGTWNRLTRNDRNESLTPKEVQKNVTEYLTGKNRALAERVFPDPVQRQLMRSHADTVVANETAQEVAAAARKAAVREEKATAPKEILAPKKIEAGPGDMQKLVEQVIGGKTNEAALFDTLQGYARKGGDVKQLARVVSQLPTEMRGDLSGAFVRELGIAPGTKQFSLDHFANQWATLTPQAKAVLFGNAGPHVTALNDIAIVANKLKTIKGKYGNPSGTAQNTLFGLLVSAAASAPYAPKTAGAAVGAALGGRVLANVLAKPAGASSALKYAQAVERAERQQSPIHMAAVKATQRNLANTARGLAATENLARK